MQIRHAIAADAQGISDLVNHHAEKGLMLHRSLESVYDGLREFLVATDDDGQLLGCAAVDIFWGDLAEIRSLAVAPTALGQGVGKALIAACVSDAAAMGIARLFAMTYEKEFFIRHGFHEIELNSLPEKIWRECLAWYAQGHRHETAMLIEPPTHKP